MLLRRKTLDKWRGLSQSEIDQSWKYLAKNGRGSPEQVQSRRKQQRGI